MLQSNHETEKNHLVRCKEGTLESVKREERDAMDDEDTAIDVANNIIIIIIIIIHSW